ncbi:MAG: AAA family ATPase [Elusimicrobiota bacterium]
MNPSVLLLDEPTNDLDPKMQSFIIEMIFRLSDAGKTIIIATHDPNIINEISPSIALIYPDHSIKKFKNIEDVEIEELEKADIIYNHIHNHFGKWHKHKFFLFHKHSCQLI